MKRCSIAWCPWKAKYSFTSIDLYECWFHGGDMPLIEWAWELIAYPVHKVFYYLRYRVCGSFPRGLLLFHIDWKFLLTPRLKNGDN